jgi:hypothetical protein
MFDNAVLINYGSSDRSVEIIRELAPHWQIVNSKNTQHDAKLVDQEVMEIEMQLHGWKMCLNTTEFLVGCPRKEIMSQRKKTLGISTSGRLLIDLNPKTELKESDSLVEEKSWGLSEDEYKLLLKSHALDGMNEILRSTCHPGYRKRLLHRSDSGRYHIGRHNWDVQNVVYQPSLSVWWCGLSPWNERGRARKANMKSRIPKSDFAQGFGVQHEVELSELDKAHTLLAPFAKISQVTSDC